MTASPRLRRHIDGRIMVTLPSQPNTWMAWHSGRGLVWASGGDRMPFDDEDPTREGWAELTVVELLNPDGWTECVGDDGEEARTPYWRTGGSGSVTAWVEGVESSAEGLQEDLDQLRAATLVKLAAIAACEQFRADREACAAAERMAAEESSAP